MEKKEVIKHSAAIQISNEVNLLQRQAFNVLLANAFNELDKQELFKISMRDLCAILKYDSNNDAHLKQLLRSLVDITVEWNVLSKDGKNEWGVAALLAEAKIINGVVIYGYAPTLRKKLHNPSMYAKINLSLQNRFQSKHSLALYELFVDYFNINSNYGETSFISIENFRKLLGLKDNEYKRYKDLNLYVIKKALNEINSESDLSVTVEYKKESRRVTALKFFIKKNPKNHIDIETIKNVINSDQKSLPFPESDVVNQELLQTLLTEFGISNNKAIAILKTKDEFYIQEVLDVVRARLKTGEVKNIPAYTVKAIEEDFRCKKPEAEIEKEKKKARKAEAQKQKEILAKLKEEFEDHCKEKVNEILEGFSEKEKAGLVREFEKSFLSNANDVVKSMFRKNGVEHPGVMIFFQGYIAEKFLPEDDRIFELYARKKGYNIVKVNDREYAFAPSA